GDVRARVGPRLSALAGDRLLGNGDGPGAEIAEPPPLRAELAPDDAPARRPGQAVRHAVPHAAGQRLEPRVGPDRFRDERPVAHRSLAPQCWHRPAYSEFSPKHARHSTSRNGVGAFSTGASGAASAQPAAISSRARVAGTSSTSPRLPVTSTAAKGRRIFTLSRRSPNSFIGRGPVWPFSGSEASAFSGSWPVAFPLAALAWCPPRSWFLAPDRDAHQADQQPGDDGGGRVRQPRHAEDDERGARHDQQIGEIELQRPPPAKSPRSEPATPAKGL